MVFDLDDTEKLNGISFDKGDVFHVNMIERRPGAPLWKDHPGKIGTLDGEQRRAVIYVPPEAFGSFWAEAEAPHNFSVSFELVAHPAFPNRLSVISVGLFEGGPNPALHPVVAEVRDAREQLWRRLKSVSNWLLFVVAVLLALSGWLLKR